MKLSHIADSLWGNKANVGYLLIASVILLFTLLGGREIWTQEHRWADIVSGMFYRHDFLHPYLGLTRYYDKPLLSYWLIAAVVQLSGHFTTSVLRLPSALAGIFAIWSIVRLGTSLKDKQLGLLSGWILLTTFYFVFWARTSSADMLNLAGTLFAVAWYSDKKDNPDIFAYMIFFLVLALTSLCKGLVGAIVPLLAVGVDISLNNSWRRHFQLPLFLAIIPALIIYILPFWASSHFGGKAYGISGLDLVYRENILRYFQPFDHKDPFYTYFLYLPIYMLPWAVFLFPALLALPSRYKSMSINAKWIAWTLLVIFAFFTLSGSRRSYYILPVVPFAVLFIADWMLSNAVVSAKRSIWLAGITVVSYLLLFLALDVLPTWYYHRFGVNHFAVLLQNEAGKIKPWNQWRVVMLDTESKLSFYLHLPPDTKEYTIDGDTRFTQTANDLLKIWPVLATKQENTIFITRKYYQPVLEHYLTGYRLVEFPIQGHLPFIKNASINAPIAFIPEK